MSVPTIDELHDVIYDKTVDNLQYQIDQKTPITYLFRVFESGTLVFSCHVLRVVTHLLYAEIANSASKFRITKCADMFLFIGGETLLWQRAEGGKLRELDLTKFDKKNKD